MASLCLAGWLRQGGLDPVTLVFRPLAFAQVLNAGHIDGDRQPRACLASGPVPRPSVVLYDHEKGREKVAEKNWLTNTGPSEHPDLDDLEPRSDLDDENRTEEDPEPRRSNRQAAITRGEVYAQPIVAGREVRENALTRLRETARRLFMSAQEREEVALDSVLARCDSVSKTNTVAVISPKGGVGKTATTFWIGNLLAEQLRLRVLCVDANPDFGTLAALAPDDSRAELSLAELLVDMDALNSPGELTPYVSRLKTGLHLLAAPSQAEVMAAMTSERYEELFEFLAQFYEVIVLDCGTEIVGALAQFALARADQTVIVTTPEWITASTVLNAQRHIKPERATLVLNRTLESNSADREIVEAHFRRQMLGAHVPVPEDQQLRTMLDSGTYALDGLAPETRLAIKRLGVAVAQQLA